MKFITLLLALLTLPTYGLNVGSQLKNAQLENRTSDYAAGTRGRIWYRTDLDRCRYDDGATVRELVGTTQAQVLTAKDIDGGTASNTSRLTVPKAATATLNALTRKEATVVVDTTTKELKVDDGSALVPQMPVGTILHFAGSSAPPGYLLGNGVAVSRTTYAALFAVTGTTYGVGDGSTTFNPPNCAGKALYGAGGALTSMANTIGATGGAETTTISSANLPAHTHGSGSLATDTSGSHSHSVTDPGHTHYTTFNDNNGGVATYSIDLQTPADATAGTTYANVFISDSSVTGISIPSGGTHSHGVTGTTGSTGSGTAATTLSPALIVNCIVKY